jgi:hypothetical protein
MAGVPKVGNPLSLVDACMVGGMVAAADTYALGAAGFSSCETLAV